MLLKNGDRGPKVKTLQGRLNEVLDPKPPLKRDGKFGQKTQDAVEAFQTLIGREKTGIVDPDTAWALEKIEAGTVWGPLPPRKKKILNLANHLERNISDYCPHKSRTKDASLHCAHWISHLLEWPKHICGPRSVGHYGEVCRNWEKFDPKALGKYGARPRLAFVAAWDKGEKDPFRKRKGGGMRIRQPRHIGVYLNGYFYHYENSSKYECVVKIGATDKKAPNRFLDRYRKRNRTCPVWLADFPPGMEAIIEDRPV